MSTHRDHGLDLLKWLAMLCMVLDHVRYVGAPIDWLYAPGRLAFPWFCLAIAENLARTGGGAPRWRYLGWLAVFAVLSEWPYRAYVFPHDTLNVLPTLLLGLLVANAWLCRQGLALALGMAALVVALLASPWLMFGWPGVLLPWVWLLVRQRPPAWTLLAGAVCVAANAWEVLWQGMLQGFMPATAGLLFCVLAPWLGGQVLRRGRHLAVPPMQRWAYAIYPAHFIVLLAIRQLLLTL